jgi:hypothetical protein
VEEFVVAHSRASCRVLVACALVVVLAACGGPPASGPDAVLPAAAAPHDLEGVADDGLTRLVELLPDGEHGVAVLEEEGRIEVVTSVRLDQAAMVLAELGVTEIADVHSLEEATLYPQTLDRVHLVDRFEEDRESARD